MNFQNTKNDLKVVISVGDESGIGPEIILKALCSNEISNNFDFILVGSKRNLQNKDYLKFHQIINIADDEPCSQIEVIKYCYGLMGLKMPQPKLFEDVKNELSPIA